MILQNLELELLRCVYINEQTRLIVFTNRHILLKMLPCNCIEKQQTIFDKNKSYSRLEVNHLSQMATDRLNSI